jgi:transposase
LLRYTIGMYIRECVTTNKATKTKYVTHRLVEAYRVTEGSIAKVRQRIIMHLGTLELPKSDWPKLAKILEARLAGQNSLFEDDTQMATAADKAMDYYSFVQQKDEEKSARKQKQTICAIDLESVEHTMSRSLGPELVAHAFWERLEVDQLLQACGLSVAEQSWAQAVVLGRLIQPASERQTGYWLKKKTSLLEMLEVDLSETGKNAIYEIGDTLLFHKKELEKELRKREEALFPQEHSLFLYDLTNTYFEGGASKNTSAHRGHSKEKRSDCPLVTLALVVDGRGFPIFSQIYKGNQSEPETLEEILKRLYVEDETLFRETLPTIVMDRGIATKNNLELLKAKHYPYIVIERRATEKDYAHEFTTAKDTFDKMDTLKEKRFLEDLARLKASVSKKGVVLATKVAERVGRIKERYPSMSQYYDISLELDEGQKKVVNLSWEKCATLTGCYVMETSHRDFGAQEIWRLYTTLVKVEEAFRDLKTDLGFRPVHHQLAERTEAHLFISVLAYHLLILIERELRNHGDHRRWSTIRDVLSTHQRTTIIMTDENDQIHHIRSSGIPESEHKELYRILNIKDQLKKNRSVKGKRL